MTPGQLAAIHAKAMSLPAPWNTNDFADLMKSIHVFDVPLKHADVTVGFALGRVVHDEAELLTIAVLPEYQRRGFGKSCLVRFEETARNHGATFAYLEVAQTNLGARALYERQDWKETGRRRAYFRGPNGRIDAILMQKRLLPA